MWSAQGEQIISLKEEVLPGCRTVSCFMLKQWPLALPVFLWSEFIFHFGKSSHITCSWFCFFLSVFSKIQVCFERPGGFFFTFCFKLNYLLFLVVVWVSSTLLSLCVLQQPQASLLYSLLDANPLTLLSSSLQHLSFLLFPFFMRVYFADVQYSMSELFSQMHVTCFMPSVCPFLVPFIWGFWVPAYNVQTFSSAVVELERIIFRGW